MTTSTLPQVWVDYGSDTVIASVSVNGAVFTQPVTLTGGLAASVTALTTAQYAVVNASAAIQNRALIGSPQFVTVVINGVSIKLFGFTGGTVG